MIQIGTYNNLTVVSRSSGGVLLGDKDSEILLPGYEVPKDLEEGETMLVFVYLNKDGEPVATTRRPYACVGDFACLKVVEVTPNGAFLDIGIDKDILVPSREQKHPMERGNSYVVFVYLDKHNNRMTASSWLEDFAEKDVQELEEGEEVSILLGEKTDLGYTAVINNKFLGLLYHNEIYEDLEIGDIRTAYVKKIRSEDGKIDLSLRPVGFDFILESKDALLEILRENNGVLNLGDKSSPDEIRSRLKMSKKAFKQVIGGLYKERKITLSDYEIRLASPADSAE